MYKQQPTFGNCVAKREIVHDEHIILPHALFFTILHHMISFINSILDVLKDIYGRVKPSRDKTNVVDSA